MKQFIVAAMMQQENVARHTCSSRMSRMQEESKKGKLLMQ
jgi:hypothetical protein